MITSELALLLQTLATWGDAPGVTVYLYGSRARSDHRAKSDIDVHVRFGAEIDSKTSDWWTRENDTNFAALKALLPGHLEILDGPDSLKRAIENAPVIAQIETAIAVDLPPKPTA